LRQNSATIFHMHRRVARLTIALVATCSACGKDGADGADGDAGSGAQGGASGSAGSSAATGGDAGGTSSGAGGGSPGMGGLGGSGASPGTASGGASGMAGEGGAVGGAGGSSGAGGSAGELCADYSGGAFIDFDIVEETLRVWVTNPSFITEAERLLAEDEARIPVFNTLLDGTGCDPQWSWRPDPMDLDFADFTIEICDGVPSYIERNKQEWLSSVGSYCPWSARVVAVTEP
jgi:hypothetical protein